MAPSGPVRHLAIATLVLALAPTAAFAKLFWVSASGGRSCTHSTLQAAIDAAQLSTDDDEIYLVGSGPFTGPFSIIGGGITIVGGVPSCGATTSGQYATLLAPAGQRPLSILMAERGRITLRRLVITTKSAALRGAGGGIWFASPSSLSELVLDDSKVVDNSCISDGGGIFISAGSLILTGRALVSANTAVNGGGIAGVNGASIRIDNAIVTANTAVLDGGGIHAPDAAVRIGELSGAGLIAAVANNRAGRDGGGIYVGAAASAANLGRATPAIVIGNQAQRGGGIFLEDAVMFLFRAAINQNTATGEGGGLHATSGAGITTGAINMLLVDGVPRFSGNQAGEGAALFADGALTDITLGAGSFHDHDTAGGAVVAARGGASLSFRGITVSGNQAPELFAVEGGAALTLQHVSIAGNDVSRLVRWDGTSPGVQVAASAFSETEPFFAGLPTPQVLPQLTCIVSHSPFLLGGMPPGTDLSQVVVADPRFMAPERGDLHAWPGSPVVDLCTVTGGGLDRDADLRGFDEPFRPTPEGQTHDAGADEVVPIGWDDFESGTLSHWTRVESPEPGSGNSVQVTTDARLGPLTSQYGLELTIVDPTVQSAFPAYLSAIPEQNTGNQSRLDGSFFIDPQSLTMASTAGLKPLRLITFRDGIGLSRPRLTFGLKRPAADKWFLEVSFWPDPIGLPTVAGSAFFACAGTPCGDPADWRNNQIDFEWRGGDPGHLTMWRTRHLNGVPDATGRVQMLSVDLPMPNAEINEVDVGTHGAAFQPAGSSGRIFLDEISFTR